MNFENPNSRTNKEIKKEGDFDASYGPIQLGRIRKLKRLISKLANLAEQEFSVDTDGEIRAIFEKVDTQIKLGRGEYPRRWTSRLERSRDLIRDTLIKELDQEYVDLLKLHLQAKLEPWSNEIIRLSATVFDWLSKGYEQSEDVSIPLTLGIAKWMIIEHTLYQLRGSDLEGEQAADEVERALNEQISISADGALFISNFMLDQLSTQEMVTKKYGLEELDAQRRKQHSLIEAENA